MRPLPAAIGIAMCLALIAPAYAGNGARPAAKSARSGQTYLSPVTARRTIVGFRPSSSRPKGIVAKFKDAARVTFGKTGPARALPHTTVWIPGHTLGWRSLRPAMKHFLKNPNNGQVAAVYVAKEGRFRAGSPRGRVLSLTEVRASKLVTVQFSNPKAGQAQKSREITSALGAIKAAHGPGGRTPIKVVTHSAGDTHFRAALMNHINPAKMGIRITGVVSVGPVFRGTWTGNTGNSLIGKALGMKQAASELAEGGEFLRTLDRARAEIDSKIEGPRTDLAFEGAPTLKLNGKPTIGDGDGFVQARDTRRPGARTQVLRGLDPTPGNHLFQIMYPGSIMAIQGALTGE